MQHKIVKMLDPQSHHNPQTKRSSSSGTLNMIPPWNIHSLCQGAVPMAVVWIGSLPPNSLNSPNLQPSWSHLIMPMMYIKSSIWSGFEINKANLRDLIAATGLVISNWIQIVNFSARVTVKFYGWPCKTIGHLFYATSSFVHHFLPIGEFKLELQSGNAQFGSKSTIFWAVWPRNFMDDPQKQ